MTKKDKPPESVVVMKFNVNGMEILTMSRAWAYGQSIPRPVHAKFIGWERTDDPSLVKPW